MVQMTYLDGKIKTFLNKHIVFRKPLEKIINIMLNKCRYINGESLERHNWGEIPEKLKNIPKNINSPSLEEKILNALNLNDSEKAIIELLWGDVQLGKRVHACIVIWISVYILKRPVLYIFRNLSIDQKQLQDDIVGTEEYNFNIQFIKNVFEEFNSELQEYNETNELWKEFKLPELKDINSNDMINRLNNKEAIDARDVFCCLMNSTRLGQIDKKFSEYICCNEELVNISVLIDEGDLISPTCSNDRTNKNDQKDTTACEILVAKICKKVKYALYITGTAHSLLYNVTTKINDNMYVQNEISKVHKMQRSSDYYGLFNNSIHFNTTLIDPWWEKEDSPRYDIVCDYNINIKKIIKEIVKRPNVKYNSLLISEEKIRANQLRLMDKIINDFPELFVIIYHGNCLRLYLSKKYEEELKRLSEWSSNKYKMSSKLWQPGGIHGSSIKTEKFEILPNNYCYFDINTKILNIKSVYKLLRILFDESCIQVLCKTIVTITGKYGERGYSFTSDDYVKYPLHLTDQFQVSHGSFSCTYISQSTRLQGKSSEIELKNGTMKLTLWTTTKLQDLMENFYVKLIKKIEKSIMSCENWDDIKHLLEKIIDYGTINFPKQMKYIDRSSKNKNFEIKKHFNKTNNSCDLTDITEMTETEIEQWCRESNPDLPKYICVNKIEEMNKNDFIQKHGRIETSVPLMLNKNEILPFLDKKEERAALDKYIKNKFKELDGKKMFKQYTIKKESSTESNDRWKGLIDAYKKGISYRYLGFSEENIYRVYHNKSDENASYVIYSTKEKELPERTDKVFEKRKALKMYCVEGDVVKYSVIKDEFKDTVPSKYYWKSPDGWLYLYDEDKKVFSLRIKELLPVTNVDISDKIVINSDVVLFTEACCEKTDKTNLRFGIKDIFEIYKSWCNSNTKTPLKTQKKFKEELEKMNYEEQKSKGVDLNNIPGKRGYNIMVSSIY